MQAVKNGLKSILRTPGRTVLFTLISIVIAALLAVSFCVFAAVRGYLADCERFYHTIVTVEYTGRDYPNETVYDEAFVRAVNEHRDEIDALKAAKEVISFESADGALALIEDFTRRDLVCYDPEAAVLKLHVTSKLEENTFVSTVTEELYSRKAVLSKLVLFIVDWEQLGIPEPERGDNFYVSGHYCDGKSSYIWLSAERLEDTELAPITLVKGAPEGTEEAYRALAVRTAVRNNAVRATRTADLSDCLPFHQQQLSLKEGRLFTEEEYASSAKSVLISDLLADLLNVGEGSTLRLSLLAGGGDPYAGVDGNVPEAEEYRIAGVYNWNEYHRYDVFLPDASAPERPAQPTAGYLLGTFRIENGGAERFIERTEPLTDDNFVFTLYDQGYSVSAEPMKELLFISTVFLTICVLLALAALLLECHLFVSKQRETAAAMLALGSGKKHVYLYFIAALLFIAIPAAAAGCVTARFLEGRVMRLLADFAGKLASEDLRFSSSRVSLIKELAFEPSIGAGVYLAAAGTLVFVTAVITALFAHGTVRAGERAAEPVKKLRKAAKSPKRERGSSSKLSGRLKYALLSTARSPARTAAIIAFALVAALFFTMLTSSLAGYKEELADYRRSAVIKGRATDRMGRLVGGISVLKAAASSIAESGLVRDHNATLREYHLRVVGVSVGADGEPRELPEIRIPESSFAQETLYDQIQNEPAAIGTLNVALSPEFYYTAPMELTWAEGEGEESFILGEGRIPCAMSAAEMAEHGIELGDTVDFLYAEMWYGSYSFLTVDMTVVASYVSANDSRTVYFPMGEKLESSGSAYDRTMLSSFTFTVSDNSELTKLRDALEEAEFAPVGSAKRLKGYAVIDDAAFLSVTRSMERQIEYVTALYYSLYAIAGVIGAVLAYLIIRQRRSEIALMRALGTQSGRLFFGFLFEAALLMALGLGLGMGLRVLTGSPPKRTALLLIAAFFAVWCVSASAALIASLRKQTMASLREPE
ncbi:MAG: ABC transporter permease [Clostridia bacterium]|nr:ABC transporter permease [Clostridia bacterium]